MRIASVGHTVFAVTMIALGTLGLIKVDFAPVWQPIPPKSVPALAYLCAFVSLASGIGLLWQRSVAAPSTFETGMFLLLVWAPIVAAGSKDAFQWSETVLSRALMAGAWVVADSYRGMPWLVAKKR